MKKFMKFGCLGLIGFIILLSVIGSLVGEEAAPTMTEGTEEALPEVETSDDTNEEIQNDEDLEEEKQTEVKVGDELQVGNVAFVVNSFEEETTITAGNGMFSYSPDSEGAVFLLVNVTVRNDDTEMIQTNSSFFKLKAGNRAEYSPTSILVADDKFFVFDGINPGLSLTGNVVFEVPSGLNDLNLQVQTGFWGTETGEINLN